MKDVKRAAIFVTILLAVGWWLVPKLVFGGTYYWHIRADRSTRLDSVMVVYWADGTLTDSVTTSSEDSIALDDTKDYDLVYYWWWDGGDSAFVDANVFAKFTGAAATISDADIGKIADSVDSILTDAHGSGTWGSAGTGLNTPVVWAIDTSGTDDTIQNVAITFRSLTGVHEVSGVTGSGGSYQPDSVIDSVLGYAARFGYTFPDTSYVFSGVDTVDFYGYNIVVDTSIDSNICLVYGYIGELGSSNLAGIPVTMTPPEGVYDTCTGKSISPQDTTVYTNSSGYWAVSAIYSSCLSSGNSHYNIEAKTGRSGEFTLKWKNEVPDSASYRVYLK